MLKHTSCSKWRFGCKQMQIEFLVFSPDITLLNSKIILMSLFRKDNFELNTCFKWETSKGLISLLRGTDLLRTHENSSAFISLKYLQLGAIIALPDTRRQMRELLTARKYRWKYRGWTLEGKKTWRAKVLISHKRNESGVLIRFLWGRNPAVNKSKVGVQVAKNIFAW